MKPILLSFLLLLSFSLFSQKLNLQEGTIRAVVIGISDYEREQITDLRFAHVDAKAFATYLKSAAGGNLPTENVQILLNERATTGQIGAAIGWLVEESQPGDKAIIYFSGHGDVERISKFQRGYLLTHDSPPNNYWAGAIPIVGGLEDIIITLSDKNVQVVMISDACRAGKLAGSSVGGTQATAATLAKQFANEVKILSCQPDEFSIEGEQWGGGRGCFSYHLLDGLYGLADDNNDAKINLLELERYLQDNVSMEAAPHRQIPMTIGNKGSMVSMVNAELLAALKKDKQNQLKSLAPIESKGIEELVFEQADTTIKKLYSAFLAAIENGNLMSPEGQSANDYYEILRKEESIKPFHDFMRRNFAAALQDESQKIVNKMLDTDPQIVNDAFSPVGKYDHIPEYLKRACELLGNKHYMYPSLKTKQHFFRSKTYRNENYPNLPPDSLLALSLISLDSALIIDTLAAYVYLEKGILHYWKKKEMRKAMENCDKAVALSPNWTVALYYAGRIRSEGGLPQEAIPILKKVVELDSAFFPIYRELGHTYTLRLGNPKEGIPWYEKYVSKMEAHISEGGTQLPSIYWHYLGNALLFWPGRFEEAEKPLLKSLELAKEPFHATYYNLAELYIKKKDYHKALTYCLKAKELEPLDPRSHQVLIDSYIALKLTKDVEESSLEALKSLPESFDANIYLAFIYIDQKKYNKAIEFIKGNKALYSALAIPYLRLGQLYEMSGQQDSALVYYNKLLALDRTVNNFYGAHIINYYLAIPYCKLGMRDKFIETLQNWKKERPNDNTLDMYSSGLCAFCGEEELSLQYLETAFKNGFVPDGSLEHIWGTFYNPDYHFIKETDAFKELVEKYLPGYYKK